tara:strand:+ start:238 stop:474 length:237 start_codon:yes stop_codon:yes gene_type:complete
MTKKSNFLDLRGFKCPIPVLKIAKKIKTIPKGDIIEVNVDDPNAENDIEELTKNINIEILKKEKSKNFLFFKIRKMSN